jgi:hypothetical protein
VEDVRRQTNLMQVILALHRSRRFARRLNCRQQQPDEDPDDRDYDKKLHQRKTATLVVLVVN